MFINLQFKTTEKILSVKKKIEERKAKDDKFQ